MKKIIKTSLLIIVLILIVYFGFVLKGVSILTWIGTPYSYFEAKKAIKKETLIFYEQELVHPFPPYINYDSLQLLYGFKWVYGGNEVSYPVIKLYNSVIEKELHCRLGKRWDEYQSKVELISKKNCNSMDIKRPPGWSESSKKMKNQK